MLISCFRGKSKTLPFPLPAIPLLLHRFSTLVDFGSNLNLDVSGWVTDTDADHGRINAWNCFALDKFDVKGLHEHGKVQSCFIRGKLTARTVLAASSKCHDGFVS